MHLCLKMAKKSVDEQSTAEYRFFYQLDWPPERVPPLIELVCFFTIQLARIARKSLEICERCRLWTLDEAVMKQSNHFFHPFSIHPPGHPERSGGDPETTHV